MKKLAFLMTLTVVLTGLGAAQSANETQSALQDAEQQIQLMEEEDIPTERVKNLLETANNSYLAQRNFEQEGGEADYSRATELADQISSIQQTAIRASDRIDALSMRLEELEETSVNLTSARNKLEAAKEDFNSQRFEEADTHIEQGYNAISEAQSARTQVESFAAAQQEAITSRVNSVADYIQANTLQVVAGLAASLIALSFIFKEFNTYRLLKRRKRKKIKEEVLEDLITDIQREYYMKKEGSSIQFETKLDRFEDMRRDVVEDTEVIDRKLEGRKSLLWSTETEETDEEIEEAYEEQPEENTQENNTSIEQSKNKDKLEEKNQTDDKDEEESSEESEEKQEESSDEVEIYDSSENDRSEDETDGEESEFICDECGKEFDTERGLHIHETRVHESEESENESSEDSEGVDCPVCGDSFDTERGMHIHRGEVHDN